MHLCVEEAAECMFGTLNSFGVSGFDCECCKLKTAKFSDKWPRQYPNFKLSSMTELNL